MAGTSRKEAPLKDKERHESIPSALMVMAKSSMAAKPPAGSRQNKGSQKIGLEDEILKELETFGQRNLIKENMIKEISYNPHLPPVHCAVLRNFDEVVPVPKGPTVPSSPGVVTLWRP